MKKQLFLFCCMAFALFSLKLDSYAYDYDTYYVTEEGEFLVDDIDRSGSGIDVTLYMYTQSDRTELYIADYYAFECVEGNFPDGVTRWPLIYKYRTDNKNVIDVLSDGEVWVWRLALENGTYCFANGDNINGKYTLTTDGKVVNYGDPGEAIVFTGPNSYEVYALNGDPEWVKEHAGEFAQWMNSMQAELMEGDSEATKNIITVYAEDLQEAPVEETEEFYLPEVTDLPVEEHKRDWGILIKGGIAFVLLCILGFVGTKRKRTN